MFFPQNRTQELRLRNILRQLQSIIWNLPIVRKLQISLKSHIRPRKDILHHHHQVYPTFVKSSFQTSSVDLLVQLTWAFTYYVLFDFFRKRVQKKEKYLKLLKCLKLNYYLLNDLLEYTFS
jgi:hypothetical protein